MNIKWNTYVDHIFVIHKIDKLRYDLLIDTLEYSNILKSGICDFIYDYDKNDGLSGYEKELNNHFLCYNYCKLFNWNRILILEDDVTIINNEEYIIECLNNIPKDFNICLLDYQIPYEELNTKNIKLNNYFSQYKKLYSAAAYIVSLNGAKELCDIYSNICKGETLDALWNKHLNNKIYCNKNLFVQREFNNKLAISFNTQQNYIDRNKLNLLEYYKYEH